MKEFISELNTLYWWISVVIVGIIINVVSAYFQKGIDNQISKTSSWWRKKSEIRNAQYQAKLKKLTNNKDEQLFLAFDELRTWFSSILSALLALAALILYVAIKLNDPNDPTLVTSVETGKNLTMIMFVAAYLGSLSSIRSAIKKRQLLSAARKTDI